MVGTIAILIWPLVVFWLFANKAPVTAVAWAILGGYLFLPQDFSFDLPGVPALNKASITAIAASLAAAMLLNQFKTRGMAPGMILTGIMPRSRLVRVLLIGVLVSVIGSVITNGDKLQYGSTVLQNLRPYDAISMLGNTIFMLLPFLLARKYAAHPEAQIKLLIALAAAGLVYTLPALFEVRMSPQLSQMVYGYFPHQWLQHVRGGGYRPVVFLHHGLWLAIFFSMSFVAALSMWRLRSGRPKTLWLIGSLWLFATLVLSKGLGALAIGVLLGGIIVALPTRLQIFSAAIIAGIVLTYPMLRGAGLIPVNEALDIAESINPQRAASLQFRVDNEDMLLTRANERPLFGWGAWGRNRVYDAAGTDISTTDGYWVMLIGTSGWIGYLAEFGLLTLPLIFLALRWRSLALTPATAGIALALTANLIDMIPNATLTPVTWLLAGALAGRLELGHLPDPATEDIPALPTRASPYSRQARRHPPQPSHPV